MGKAGQGCAESRSLPVSKGLFWGDLFLLISVMC